MRRILQFTILLSLCLLAVMPKQAKASHAMGADITYTCIAPNTYQVTVAFYRDCDGIPAPSSITVDYFSPTCSPSINTLSISQSGNCPGTIGAGNGSEVSPLCSAQASQSTCNGGNLPGVEVYYYCGTIVLPSNCPDWVIGYGECCRNDAITNLGGGTLPSTYDQYVFATVNNTNGICNNSPSFTSLPVPYFCPGEEINYNHGTVDFDGDSLVYTLVNPLDDYGVPIPYNSGFSPTQPMTTTTGFGFDTLSGQMNFTASGQQVAVITVQVDEYRNGVLVGSTMRDIQVVILNPALCSSPPTQVIDSIGGSAQIGTIIPLCPNTPISIDLSASDPDGNNLTMTSNSTVSIPGANFTVSGTGPSVTGVFTWTPTAADTGLNSFVVTVTDDGCPFNQSSSVSYDILVVRDVRISAPTSVFCNDPIQLQAFGGSTFNWSPSAGLSASNISNPIATPSVPTNYIVTSSCGSDTIFVDVQPDFNLSVSNDTSICLNSIVQLEAISSPAATGPYTYEWSPPFSLSNATSGSPLAQPLANTTYTVTATSNGGCEKIDTIQVNIQGIAPKVSALTAIDTVCPGGLTQLSLAVAPNVCGLNSVPCNTPNNIFELGNSNQFSTSTNTFPAIYGSTDRSAGHQLLYLASELNANGTNGGVISEIAFNMAQINGGTTYTNFSIRVLCTSVTQLTSWQAGAATVFTPKTVNVTPGWNTYTFDTPYNWDGTSNLVVQICFRNTTSTSNNNVFYTNTPFNSVYFQRTNTTGLDACSTPSSFGSSNQRPNTRFGICLQPIGNNAVNWEPANLFTDPTEQNPQVRVFGTTTFVANVDDGGCIGSGYVEVYVDTTVILDAGPDTSLCVVQPVQLFANAVGTPSPITLSCGANGTVCQGPTNQQVVGVADGIAGPTPFNGDYADQRMQILYRASDLDAAGVQTGVINELAFNTTKSSFAPFPEFTVKMGCTNLSSLSGNFVGGLTEVFAPKDVTTANGWTTLILDNTFDWDGFSNIIVEVCFNNFDFNTVNKDRVPFTNTPYPSVLFATDDFGNGCLLDNTTFSFTASSSRPDIRIGYCDPPPGTFTYQWSPTTDLSDPTIANPVFTGSISRAYSVTVTDGSCLATDSVTIEYYTGYDSNVFGNDVGCNGAADGNLISVPIGGVGPYSFEWSTGQITTGEFEDTVFNLNAGTYNITLTDNNGCTQTDAVTLTVPPPLTVSLAKTDIECAGGSDGNIVAGVSGGTTPYGFDWSNGDTTAIISNLVAGTYVLTITDGSGCTLEDSATIIEPAGITLTTSTIAANCYLSEDGSATVNATGGIPPYDYTWSNAGSAATINNLGAGAYIVTVSDQSNCSRTDTAIVTQPDSFSINTSSTMVSCYNGSDGTASASVNGDVTNYTFDWQSSPPQSGPTASNLPRGGVTVEVTDTNGCSIQSVVTVGAPQPTLLGISVTDVTCNNGSDGTATVSVVSGGTGPFTYLWDDGTTTPTVSGLSAGDYYVTATDDQGCEAFDTTTIAEPAPISISESVTDVSCFGETDGSITVQASGGTSPYTYVWPSLQGQGTGQTVSDLAEGTYDVIVTDDNDCSDTLTGIAIAQPTALAFTAVQVDSVSCPGESDGSIFAEVSGGTGNINYNLDGTAQGVGDFISLGSGPYDLTATDDNGCSIDTSLTVLAPPSLVVEFVPDSFMLTLGDTIGLAPVVSRQDPAHIYSWEPSNTIDCSTCPSVVATPLLTTAYEVTVMDEYGCPYSDIAIVEVENNLILYVPNAFSPNGDGYNDFLEVFGISLEKVNFKVFNRWGEKVYEGNTLQQGWDGTYKGNPVRPGVYVYFVEVTYTDGQQKTQKGSITIIK